MGLDGPAAPEVAFDVAVVGRDIPSSLNPLGWPSVLEEPRLGFNGLSVRDGGRAKGVSAVPPVTRLRMPGRGPLPLALPDPEPLPEPDDSVFEKPGRGKTMSSSESPAAWRRAFSCLFCKFRKCERSSDHLMSSRPSLERVAETFGTFLRQGK